MAMVSFHPYFKVKKGKMDAIKAVCAQLVPICKAEEKCLYVGFTFNGDTLFCREAYDGAEGVIAHLGNAKARKLGGDMAEAADIERVEIHASAEDIKKLKEVLKGLNATYFTLEFGD